jgi:hypothetical protein
MHAKRESGTKTRRKQKGNMRDDVRLYGIKACAIYSRGMLASILKRESLFDA